jgi:RHS repeat-associated protein
VVKKQKMILKKNLRSLNPYKMSKRFRYLLTVSGLFMMLGFAKPALAQNQKEPPYIETLDGATGSLAVDSSRTVMDSAFFDPLIRPTILRTNYVNNFLIFKINEISNRLLPDSFVATLTIKVIYEDANNLADSIAQKVLTVDYNKNKSYNNKAVFYFQGAYRVTAKVVSLTAQYTSLSNILPVLQLQNEMFIDRQYEMDCTDNAIQSISKDESYISTLGELMVFWTPSKPAEEYDLEWTFIDQTAIDAGWYYNEGTTQLNPDLIFRDNATRVSIKAGSYKIPLLYEGDGKLFYRVRGVQTLINGERKVTAWSSDYVAQGGLGQYTYTGHERKLNWQTTTSFAEEGKRKTVIQYFDGHMKARQTVTKDNFTNTTVVAETFYDKQGRPAIQVMPAPTLSSLIKYTPLFNTSINGSEYDKTLYDTVINANELCDAPAPAMGADSGAAKYYSGNNPLKTEGFHQFIPDAGGYAFTETRYTADNTGRILKQSGVDTAFKIGSGHETRYYYGSPDQMELDALFGTEVGDASHYQKNMVRDANGQYSVSYVDMHGRTIATALAGNVPQHLQSLSSYRDSLQTDPLLNKTNNIIKGNSIELTKGLVVTKSGPHQFIYQLNPQSLQLADCNNQAICYDCLYDLEITITDECGNPPIVIQRKNFTLNQYDTTCTNPSVFAVDTTITLSEGSYTVTKRLTIHEEGMNWYRDSLYAQHNTCKTEDSIINEQRQLIINQLGNCNQPETGNYLYQQYREQVLLDVTPPSGQYAKFPVEATPAISIFNTNAQGVYKYQLPFTPYLDENGNRDSVVNRFGVLVAPEQLDTTDFVNNFKPSWANSLLGYHPEVCLLNQYESMPASHRWEEGFRNTDTYSEAWTKGYLNLLNTSNPVDSPAHQFPAGLDSLFTYSFGATAKTVLRDSLLNYRVIDGKTYTLWNFATIMGHCQESNTNCANTFRIKANAFKADSLSTGELDMAWRYFRDEYLRLKQQWIDGYIRSQCSNPVIPSGGIAVFTKPADAISGSGLTNPGGNYTQAGNDSLAALGGSTCEAYAVKWWEQLTSCGYSSADSAIIIPRLIEVCKQGSDSTHPYGASTVRPASAYQYRSFEDVIKGYNQSIGKPYNGLCNAFLIDAPKPYNQPYALANQVLYSKPDSCECKKIDTLYNQYIQSGGYETGNFSSFLLTNYGTSISQGTLDSLRNYCIDTIKVKYLVNPLILPPALQCGVQDVCVGCSKVKQLYDTFLVKYPGAYPGFAEADTLQVANNTVFANWMNHNLGFSKTAQQYLAFIDSCKGIRTVTGVSFADTLIGIRNDFINYYYNYGAQYDADGIDTTTWKVNFGGSSNNTGVPHRDIFVNGIAQFPNNLPPAPNSRVDFDYMFPPRKDSMCVNNNFTIAVRFKYSAPDTTPNYGLLPILYADNGNHNFSFYRNTTAFGCYSHRNRPAPLADTVICNNPEFVQNFTDWKTLKLEFKNQTLKVYMDTVLLKSFAYVTAINKLYGYSFSFTGYPYHIPGAIDWIKVYDSTGKVMYNEDFLAPHKFAHIGDSTTCTEPPCSDAFAAYYNSKRQTSLSYTQINNIYLSNLNENAMVCGELPSYTMCGKNEASAPPIAESDIQPLPCADSTLLSIMSGTEIYKTYKDSVLNHFNEQYTRKCLSAAALESFSVSHSLSEYHYTLYYYDQAGNLVKTVPPQGVKPERGATFLSSVAAARANGTLVTPGHELPTVYRYNSLNGVVTQKTPDAGLSKFWYDRLGRMAISQNAKQAANSKYSYTLYDYLGRPTEVAEKLQYTAMTNTISRNAGSLQGWIRFGNKESLFRPKFVTLTVYDELSQGTPWWQCGSFADRFAQKAWTLRNRVSFTRYDEDLEYNYYINNGDTIYTPVMDGYITGIDYSYDIHGNVDRMANIYWYGTMMQYYGCNNNKVIEYKYDLISGKVNEVHFNPGENDEFYHRYYYDAENRITDVYTTDNKMFLGNEDLEEHDAHYEYYKHGPLARTVLGQQQVQGIDYAYTLQGWLKGVNSTSLNADHDMGLDGKVSGNNWYIGRDAYGFNLNYFTGEYKSINTSVNPFPGHSAYLGSSYRPLYNGNISSMAVNIGKFNQPQLYNYEYDQLNRIVGMDVYRGLDQTNNNWNSLAVSSDYKERVQYDANGKILKYLRQGHGSNLTMDSLSYNYYSGTNKLSHIRDQVNGSTSHNANYTEDLNDQGTNNYTYDEIGNLKTDASENIQHIEWTPYGKIHEISKLSSPLIHSIYVKYFYDPAGNRIGKTEEYAQDDAHFNWFVKDAQGNIMATYQVTGGWAGEGPLLLKEHHLYGSKRLGVIKRDWNMQEDKYTSINANLIGPTYLVNLERGRKQFDLSNHLENNLVVISDKKTGVSSNGTTVDYYNADVVNAQDYYPFGFVQPNRKYSLTGKLPTYTFNGKMNDPEVKGDGLQLDYGNRIYDPRCGCFLSVDPLSASYPWYTPYQFAGNKPIISIDLDGLEELEVNFYYTDKKLMNKASELSVSDPQALAILQQTHWNEVIAKLDELVAKNFDPNKNIDPNTGGRIFTQVVNSFLHSDAVTKYVSVVNFDVGNSVDILQNLEQKAEQLANDHFRSAFFGINAYTNELKSINEAKDPNEKAMLIEARHEKGLEAFKFVTFTNFQFGEILGGFLGLGKSNIGQIGPVGNKSFNLNGKTSASTGSWTKVGRWMSETEYKLMQQTGRVQEGSGGQTFASTLGPEDFGQTAYKGSIYVEYEVPTNSLISGGRTTWVKNVGPSANKSMQTILKKQGGQLLPRVRNLSGIIEKKK